jgi:hypothetical protein
LNPDGALSNPVKIPLSTTISSEKIVILTKTLGQDEKQVGSVSIPQHIILNGGVGSFTQWITLFEHRDDDEYDGQMGLEDEEEPRVQVNFVIGKNAAPPSTAPTTTATKRQEQAKLSSDRSPVTRKLIQNSSTSHLGGRSSPNSAMQQSEVKTSHSFKRGDE